MREGEREGNAQKERVRERERESMCVCKSVCVCVSNEELTESKHHGIRASATGTARAAVRRQSKRANVMDVGTCLLIAAATGFFC